VKFMGFDASLARAGPGEFAIRAPAATTKHREQPIDKINIPREELEDVMLAELQLIVPCAKVREVAIFGAAGLRGGATWIVASFLSGSSDAERNLETVRRVERELQFKYDMMLGS